MSISLRSSQRPTSTKRRSELSLIPNPLSLMKAFSILSICLILFASPLTKRKKPKVRCIGLLRATTDTVLYEAIGSAHPGIDDEQLRAVMPTAHDDEQEVGP